MVYEYVSHQNVFFQSMAITLSIYQNSLNDLLDRNKFYGMGLLQSNLHVYRHPHKKARLKSLDDQGL